MSPSRQTDEYYMRLALECAERGVGKTRPNPPVGAVVVTEDGVIAGTGFHARAGAAHAEVVALAACGDIDLSRATIYVTLEPCSTHGRTPPCVDLLIRRRVKRVVAGRCDPNPAHSGRGFEILRRAGIEVVCGVCEAECRYLTEPFESAILRKRPHLTLKLAMSLDGRIADSSGKSKWITGAESREFSQSLRRRADAILVGSQTAIADDPELRCRLPDAADEAWRLVADSSGRIDASLRLVTDAFAARTIIATTAHGADFLAKKLHANASVELLTIKEDGAGHLDLASLLSTLTAKFDVMEILCEGGGTLAGALLNNGLVDRLVVFHAPIILGSEARASFAGCGFLLDEARRMSLEETRVFGQDIMASYVIHEETSANVTKSATPYITIDATINQTQKA